MIKEKLELKLSWLKVLQLKSIIKNKKDQKKTLLGLGLGRINKESILRDTPAVRGMLKKVKHLIKVEIYNN